MSKAFEARIEWLDAPGVSARELAATWARFELWVDGNCVTQVQSADSTIRRSVYGSLYPLAEWIASNWWVLISHVRPSGVETRYWTWSNARTHHWLFEHNLRGAGDGMAWPDLTLVPEGPITRIHWAADRGRPYQRIRFVTGGDAWIRTSDAIEGLSQLVNHVLERLAEEGTPKTRLAEEWTAVGQADEEEQEFCRTVARLGLDPYSVSDETADEVVAVAAALPGDLVSDFFDSADPAALAQAAEWTRRALPAASRAATKAERTLGLLREATEGRAPQPASDIDLPWQVGYELARRVRSALQVPTTSPFDIRPWIGKVSLRIPSGGVQGAVAVERNRCGVVLQGGRTSPFSQARALGRILARPRQESFILSAARGHDERVSRAFAAELLAPAAGIREKLDALGEYDDLALETVAGSFGVSPLVVRHQYDNQLAAVTPTGPADLG